MLILIINGIIGNLILLRSSSTATAARDDRGGAKLLDYWKERTIYTLMSTVATDLARYASNDVQKTFATCLHYCIWGIARTLLHLSFDSSPNKQMERLRNSIGI